MRTEVREVPCAVVQALDPPRVVNDDGVARVVPAVGIEACPGCEGQGFRRYTREDGYVYVRDCEGRAALRRAALFDRAGLPGRYAEATLAQFQPRSVSLGAAREAAMEFVRAWPATRTGLVIVGDPGVGKTHLLVGILRELALDKGAECRYADFSHLVNDLRAAISRRERAADLIQPLVDAEVLAVDDLGRGLLATDYEAAVIDELVSRRYNADRLTLFSTNFPDLPGRTGSGNLTQGEEARPSLQQIVGERVVSRLRQMCRFVSIQAEDFRAFLAPKPVAGRSPPRPRGGR